MQAQLTVRKAHIGHWALGCSLASLILLVSAVWLILATFCVRNCHPDPLLSILGMVSVLGFLAAILATVVLSIRALVLRRQPRWAVAALIVMFLPAILVGVQWGANMVTEMLS
jgi:hypothetical protein